MLPTGCTAAGLMQTELALSLSLGLTNPTAFPVLLSPASSAAIREVTPAGALRLVGEARFVDESLYLPPHSYRRALVVVDFRYLVARLGIDHEIRHDDARFGATHTPQIIDALVRADLLIDLSLVVSVLGIELKVRLPQAGRVRIRDTRGESRPGDEDEEEDKPVARGGLARQANATAVYRFGGPRDRDR